MNFVKFLKIAAISACVLHPCQVFAAQNLKWEGVYETEMPEEGDPPLGQAHVFIEKDDNNNLFASIEFYQDSGESRLVCRLNEMYGEVEGNRMRLFSEDGKNLILFQRVFDKDSQPSRGLKMSMASGTPKIFGICEVDDDGKEFELDDEFAAAFREGVFEGMTFAVSKKQARHAPPPLMVQPKKTAEYEKRGWRSRRMGRDGQKSIYGGETKLRKFYKAITGD